MLQPVMAWQGYRRRNSVARRRLSTYAVPQHNNVKEEDTDEVEYSPSCIYEESNALPRLRAAHRVEMNDRNSVTKDTHSSRARRLGRDISKDITKWEKLAYRLSYASKVPEMVGNMDIWNRVLDPDGKWCFNWMGIVALSTFYNIAVIILRLAFSEMREMWLACFIFGVLDIVCDCVYIADIWVQSRISYHEDGVLVENLNLTRKMYSKRTRFKLDIAAIFPLYIGASIIFGTFNLTFLDVTFITTNNLFTPFTRLPRLLKGYIIPAFFDATDCRTSNPNRVRGFKLSLYLCLVIHWIGCLYYILSEFEGIGSTEWVYSSGNKPDCFQRKYIRCIYWSLLILTTIGERPSPETDIEYIFTGLTFVIGVFVFAAVVGNVGDVISNMNASRQEFQARMDQVKFYMQHRQVPAFLQDRVKRWAQYTWARTQAIDEPQLLQMLPERLQMDVAIQVHLNTLKKVKIFEECEEGLLRELVLKLRPQIYSPGDYICHIGDIGREMYIINHGKIEIIVPNKDTGQRTVVATLGAGNYFGEISLLKLDAGHNRRTADVRSVGYSELLCLSRKDLMAALVEYPDAKKVVETQARERMRQTLELRSINAEKPRLSEVANSYICAKRNKRETLLDVIKSEGFQKLVIQSQSKGSSESEMQNIVLQLRDCQAQALELAKHRASDDCKKLEKELQETRECLRKTQTKLRLVQKELDKHNTKDSKGLKKRHKPNAANDASLSLSKRQDSESQHLLSNKYISDHSSPDKKQDRQKRSSSFSPPPVTNTFQRPSILAVGKRYNRTQKFGSEDSLLHSISYRSKLVREVPLQKTDNKNTNTNPPKLFTSHRHPAAARISKCSVEQSVDTQNNEPARQSSGYSSDTETMATLLRVSSALEQQGHYDVTSSSDDSDDSSGDESDISFDRMESNFDVYDSVTPCNDGVDTIVSQQPNNNSSSSNNLRLNSKNNSSMGAFQDTENSVSNSNKEIYRRKGTFSPPPRINLLEGRRREKHNSIDDNKVNASNRQHHNSMIDKQHNGTQLYPNRVRSTSNLSESGRRIKQSMSPATVSRQYSETDINKGCSVKETNV